MSPEKERQKSIDAFFNSSRFYLYGGFVLALGVMSILYGIGLYLRDTQQSVWLLPLFSTTALITTLGLARSEAGRGALLTLGLGSKGRGRRRAFQPFTQIIIWAVVTFLSFAVAINSTWL